MHSNWDPFTTSFVTKSNRLRRKLLLPTAYEIWGKVLFSQACVIHSVHRGGVSGQGGLCLVRRGVWVSGRGVNWWSVGILCNLVEHYFVACCKRKPMCPMAYPRKAPDGANFIFMQSLVKILLNNR